MCSRSFRASPDKSFQLSFKEQRTVLTGLIIVIAIAAYFHFYKRKPARPLSKADLDNYQG
jgi:hypothetical protein